MKKISLTSLIAIAFAMPAFAESFPNDAYMLENKTYDNAATYDNMGVYEDSVTADANYEWDVITVDPGYYIPQSSTTASQCTAGSFCPGITANNEAHTPHYDSTSAQGITSCSTLESGAYPNSAAGATSNTNCYRACTVANANIDHATAVSGNDYYGAGADTCTATACENGYHVAAGSSDLYSMWGDNLGWGWNYPVVYKDNEGQQGGSQNFYNLTDNNSFASLVRVSGNPYIILGHGRCSSVSGTGMWSNPAAATPSDITTHTTAELGEEGGQNCYCRIDGYIPDGGELQSVSSPWVFTEVLNSAEDCAQICANNCGFYINNEGHDGEEETMIAFFSAAIEPSGSATCAANEITITWNGASAEDIAANEAGTVTYGGHINTPRAATQIPGRTFIGWKFVKPANSGN